MRLTKEDLLEIANMIERGESTKNICKKYNYLYSSMNRIIKRYKSHGIAGILHKTENKKYSIEEKIKIINRHYSGESKQLLAIEINVSSSVVNSWIKKYEQLGYNGLIDNRGRPGVTKMGRPRKNIQNNNNKKMAPLSDAEREELNELRKRTQRLEMEIEATKKLNALVQARIERETQKKRK